MNKRQKETAAAQLADEKKVLAALKKHYKQAAKDAAEKISFHQDKIDKIEILLKDLDGADDDVRSLLQSQIYQKQYQEALKKQIDGIVDNMNQKQYKTVDAYLKGCYEKGFLSSMYDLHGQGIPIITPIDQKAMVKAATLDSKISKKLYGTYTNELKTRIQAEVSRGIATNQQYAAIARNLNMQTGIGLNKAMRIARTEGHGVQIQAAVDAQYKAKEAGADILKQWNSVLDGKTRTSHRQMDGELRELDEKFSNGMKYPSDPAGGAAEVVNCRCLLMQRSRKAMDEDELQRLKDRAEYFKIDKTDSFNDFQKKYLKAAAEEEITTRKVDFKTVKEAEDFMEELVGGFNRGKCDLSGIEMKAANKVAESYQKVLHRYPQMKGHFAALDTSLTEKGTYAVSYRHNGHVRLNLAYYANYEAAKKLYARNVASGFHPAGTEMDSTVTHEIGHAIEGFLTYKGVMGADVYHTVAYHIRRKVLKELKLTKKDIATEVSMYASKNDEEFIAECFAEYMHSENPRPVAKRVGELIDELMKGVQ